MKLINVCGARPNFMKISPLMEAYRAFPDIEPIIVHTGQHYDDNMSRLFFDELGIPRPDFNLDVGSGSHARQTAEIMTRFEPLLIEHRPDAVLVVGDVNSTIACVLVACKLGIPTIHVEAGLRSFDRSMPEEINRVLTDAVSNLLFVSEPSGETNLLKEGRSPQDVHFVGNVMIDTLRRHLERARQTPVHDRLLIHKGRYGVITLHRPANVDCRETFEGICEAFGTIQQELPLVFCMHPRTRNRAEEFGLLGKLESLPNLQITAPLGYLEFLHLMAEARAIFTDSGGIQEEATILKVPCLTLRENTERPITLTHGTNTLVGCQTRNLIQACTRLDEIRERRHRTPPLWDGQASARIAQMIHERFVRNKQ